MNCHKVQQCLSAFMDGELQGVEHRCVHDHLQRCTACRSEYDGLLFTKRLVGCLGVREPRPELSHLILNRLHNDRDLSTSLWQQMQRFFEEWFSSSPVRSNGVAIGAACAIVAVLFVINDVSHSDDIEWLDGTTVASRPAQELPDMADVAQFNGFYSSSVADETIIPIPETVRVPNLASPMPDDRTLKTSAFDLSRPLNLRR